jgi:glycolate oxidase iron-sulfur subunit
MDLEQCIHCGLCLTACPTYRTLKIEPDSPRGRLYLMRGLEEGRVQPDDPLVAHLDNCLDCRACETVCPAGVPYGQLLEATRGQIERRVRRASPLRLLGHFVLRSVLPVRARMHVAVDLLRMGQSGPIAAFMRSGLARRVLPRFATQGFAMTPALAPRAERELAQVAARLPKAARYEKRADADVFLPASQPKLVVAFHTTCVMEAMFPRVNQATVRLLVMAGAEVHVPRAQSCCGALHAHAGLREEAKTLGRANARAFAGTPDFVVSHSAGCGAALRETGHLLHGESEAQALSDKVRDVSEVLAHLGFASATATPQQIRKTLGLPASDAPVRVAYHDPCHLAHAQRVREAPRRLLRAIPGVQFVELPDSDWCCGSAGVYNLSHPHMAQAQLDQKLERIARVTPDVVIASNPGCLLQMQRGAVEQGSRVRMLHLVELLDAAAPHTA